MHAGRPQLHWVSTQLCNFGAWKKVLAFLGASDGSETTAKSSSQNGCRKGLPQHTRSTERLQ